ncbi:MAG: hypothetical protein KJ725_13490 [Gammaproteobacteria bacterium]|nr:hypothetical protein [Gammaproteobacteria bacterium]
MDELIHGGLAGSSNAGDGVNADFAAAKIYPACFQAFFATTASADFSKTLIREIFLGFAC